MPSVGHWTEGMLLSKGTTMKQPSGMDMQDLAPPGPRAWQKDVGPKSCSPDAARFPRSRMFSGAMPLVLASEGSAAGEGEGEGTGTGEGEGEGEGEGSGEAEGERVGTGVGEDTGIENQGGMRLPLGSRFARPSASMKSPATGAPVVSIDMSSWVVVKLSVAVEGISDTTWAH